MSMTKEAIAKFKEQMGWVGSVYRLTFPDGRVYVGQTMQNVEGRWKEGKAYKECGEIFDAIVWFGWKNITKEILYSGLSRLQAYYYERKTIEEMRSDEKGKGFNGNKGRKYGQFQVAFVLSRLRGTKADVFTTYIEADEYEDFKSPMYVSTEKRLYKIEKIDDFIFYGTPTKEAPKEYEMWLHLEE